MIEGEKGTVVLDKLIDLRDEIDGDEIGATLLAAVFADAMRKGCTPRMVLDDLWKALPDDGKWEQQAELLLEAIDDREEAA